MLLQDPTRINYTAGIPVGATGTVTLFNSATAFPGGCFHMLGQQWFSYFLRTASDGGTATGTITGSYSTDKGVTWVPFYQRSTADADDDNSAAVGDVVTDDVYVGIYKDIRFQYTNAVEQLTVFQPGLSLHPRKPASKSVNGAAIIPDPLTPVRVTDGAVTSWFRVADGTITGSGYSSIPDVLNGSSPLTQSTDALRPPAARSTNNLPILNISAHVLVVPLIASRINVDTWGMWFWLNRSPSANNLTSIGTTPGSSVNRSYVEVIGGNNMRVQLFTAGGATVRQCDAAMGSTGSWVFITIEYNGALSGDARLTRTLNGSVVSVSYGGTAAAVPSQLNAVTGNATFGAFSPAAAFPFIGKIGPNFGYLGAAMPGATEGLLTPAARLALMNFEAPT